MCDLQQPKICLSGRYRLVKTGSPCGIASTAWPFSTKVEWVPSKLRMADSMIKSAFLSVLIFVVNNGIDCFFSLLQESVFGPWPCRFDHCWHILDVLVAIKS